MTTGYPGTRGAESMAPIRRCIPRTPVLVTTTLAFLAGTLHAGQVPDRTPERITRYDFATRDDLLFAHLLEPLMKGDVADWPILGGLGAQLGDWVNQFVDARQIADIITEAFPIEGQP